MVQRLAVLSLLFWGRDVPLWGFNSFSWIVLIGTGGARVICLPSSMGTTSRGGGLNGKTWQATQLVSLVVGPRFGVL